jgi:hypothetical protein
LPQKANSSCEDGVRLQIFQQSNDVRVSDHLAFPLMPIARIGGHELAFGLGFLKPGRDLVDRALQRALQQFGFDRTFAKERERIWTFAWARVDGWASASGGGLTVDLGTTTHG